MKISFGPYPALMTTDPLQNLSVLKEGEVSCLKEGEISCVPYWVCNLGLFCNEQRFFV